MANPFYFPTAIQEAGKDSTSARFRTAGVQPPLPTAFDKDRTAMYQRVAVTANSWRAAFGCMYSAEGVTGNINTANFWLNRTRAWRTRFLSVTAGGTVITDLDDMDSSTFFPSVTNTYTPPDQMFNTPTEDFRSWFGGASYDTVDSNPNVTAQNVDSGNYNDGSTIVAQSLSNEVSAGPQISDMQTFLMGLNMLGLWGASPPVIYHDYFKNIYNTSAGDYNNPGYHNLSSTYSQYNTDITNLAADRTTYLNYPYDGVYYPLSNFSTDEILPSAPATAPDVGGPLTGGTLGIAGDASRCSVGFIPHCGDNAGVWSIFCDRVQYRLLSVVQVTTVEVASAYGTSTSGSAWTLVREISNAAGITGAISEIPQPSSPAPFISSQGGAIGDVCVFGMKTAILFNSSTDALVAAMGGSSAGVHRITSW